MILFRDTADGYESTPPPWQIVYTCVYMCNFLYVSYVDIHLCMMAKQWPVAFGGLPVVFDTTATSGMRANNFGSL